MASAALCAVAPASAQTQPGLGLSRPFPDAALRGTLSDGLMFERRLFHGLFATADQKEGMDAFVNKRPANFTHQ